MSHGFSRILTDQDGLRKRFRRLLFDNDRKKFRENPCESVRIRGQAFRMRIGYGFDGSPRNIEITVPANMGLGRVLFKEMSHGFSPILTDQDHAKDLNLAVMTTPSSGLKHAELTEKIIGVFYDVYNELGYGFLESTYAAALVIALEDARIKALREVSVPVWFREKKVGQYYADLIVGGIVILELKTARTLELAHEAQLLHYLRATEVEVGMLLNFGLRPQFRRLLFDNDRKKFRENPCESVARVSA